MNDVMVNSVIQNLCDKFNVAASELIPRSQAYGLAMSKLGIVISAVFVVLFLIICAITVYGLYRRDKACGCIDVESYFACTFAFMAVDIIPTTICIINTVNYVGWKYAPEIKAMEYVMNMIRK